MRDACRNASREAVATHGALTVKYAAGFRIGDPRADAATAAVLAPIPRLDELHTEYPFYGGRQSMRQPRRDGVTVGRHWIRRLRRRMGIEAS